MLEFGSAFAYEAALRIFSANSIYNWGQVSTAKFADALYANIRQNIGVYATNRRANINGEICHAYRFDPYWVFYADEGEKRVIKYFRHEKEDIEWIW